MDNLNELSIPIEDCFKPYDESFSRVQYFLCIADNLDTQNLPSQWSIPNSSGITYNINTPKDDGERNYIVQGYKHFIRCYLVRDCIESFALCLDNLFWVLLLNGKRLMSHQTLLEALSQDEVRSLNFFKNKGLSDKLPLLDKYFNIKLKYDYCDIVLGLRDIRNCFSHSNGFVRATDGKETDNAQRYFSWKAMHLFALGSETGKEYPVKMGEVLPEAGSVCVRFADHRKAFNIGDQLNFTITEVYEIAFSLKMVGANLMEEVKKVLQLKQQPS